MLLPAYLQLIYLLDTICVLCLAASLSLVSLYYPAGLFNKHFVSVCCPCCYYYYWDCQCDCCLAGWLAGWLCLTRSIFTFLFIFSQGQGQ